MDDELVARAARGDADAFDALARDRIDRLFAIAFRILRDHHDAEDACSTRCGPPGRTLPGLRDPGRFDAWLYRLLIRACYRAGHSRRRRAAIVSIVPEMDDLPGTATADAIVDRDALERAFASLSTEHRAVAVLHHYLGLGLDEIAAIVGVPHGTARSRLHYALLKLRSTIEATEPLDRRGRGVRTMNENHRSDDIVRAWVLSGSRAGHGRPRRTDAATGARGCASDGRGGSSWSGSAPGPGRCRGRRRRCRRRRRNRRLRRDGAGRSSGADAGPCRRSRPSSSRSAAESGHRDLHRGIRRRHSTVCTPRDGRLVASPVRGRHPVRQSRPRWSARRPVSRAGRRRRRAELYAGPGYVRFDPSDLRGGIAQGRSTASVVGLIRHREQRPSWSRQRLRTSRTMKSAPSTSI